MTDNARAAVMALAERDELCATSGASRIVVTREGKRYTVCIGCGRRFLRNGIGTHRASAWKRATRRRVMKSLSLGDVAK